MRFPAWLLILAEPDSATAGLFAGTTADVVSQRDVDAIAAKLRERYRAFRAGSGPTRSPAKARSADASKRGGCSRRSTMSSRAGQQFLERTRSSSGDVL